MSGGIQPGVSAIVNHAYYWMVDRHMSMQDAVGRAVAEVTGGGTVDADTVRLVEYLLAQGQVARIGLLTGIRGETLGDLIDQGARFGREVVVRVVVTWDDDQGRSNYVSTTVHATYDMGWADIKLAALRSLRLKGSYTPERATFNIRGPVILTPTPT